MTALDSLGYAADGAILSTYWYLSATGKALRFHLANALGCIPLIAIEVHQAAWPVLPLTAAFGVIGTYGLWKDVHGH